MLLGLQPAVFYVADEPSKHSGRLRATELFNGSMWRAAPFSSSDDEDDAPATAAFSWLGSPFALLEGARAGGGSSSSSAASPVTLPVSIADPRLRSRGGGGGGSLELTLAAGGTGTGSGVLEGGVVAAAIDASGRAGFGGGRGGKSGGGGEGFLSDPRREVVAAEAASLDKKEHKSSLSPSSSSSSPQGGDGVLELRDVALYIDVAAPTEAAAAGADGGGGEGPAPPSSAPLGAKQGVNSFYGCSGSPLGTLSSFGNACGLYGSGYFGGGMLGDTSGFGGGGTIG